MRRRSCGNGAAVGPRDQWGAAGSREGATPRFQLRGGAPTRGGGAAASPSREDRPRRQRPGTHGGRARAAGGRPATPETQEAASRAADAAQ